MEIDVDDFKHCFRLSAPNESPTLLFKRCYPKMTVERLTM